MTTAKTVGAASRKTLAWAAIDWQTAQRNVHRLQVRIVQATKAGRWGKVKALQRLLTHSYSGKVLAVGRVTGNAGKKTAGVDRRNLEHTAEESSSSTRVEGTRLSATTPSAYLHPQSERQDASSGHPHDGRQSHASTSLARSRPRCGNQS